MSRPRRWPWNIRNPSNSGMGNPTRKSSQKTSGKENVNHKASRSHSRSTLPPEKGNLKDKAENGITAGKKSGNPGTEPTSTKEPTQKAPESQAHNKPQINKAEDPEKAQKEQHQHKDQATQTLDLNQATELEKDQSSDDSFWDTPDPLPQDVQEK